MQRKLGWMAALAVVVGCGPQETPYASPSPAAAAPAGAGAYASPAAAAPVGPISGEFAAEVVSVDASARTVTLRESAVGGEAAATAAARAATIAVEGAAGDSLRDFKAGDRVVVSCLLKDMPAVTGTASPAPANLLANCSSVTAIRKAV